MTILNLTDNIKNYINKQIDIMSTNNPMISFVKPIITRIIDNNYNKITSMLGVLADDNGEIDANGILSDMITQVDKIDPFIVNTSFMGDIKIGGGNITINIPMTNKNLVLTTQDLEDLKTILTTNRE